MRPSAPVDDSTSTQRLLDMAARGDADGISRLVQRHHDWLLAFAEPRLDRRVRARADAADVVQEAEAEVCTRIDDFIRRRPVSFRAWLLKTVYDHLGKLKRRHVVAECRSVLQEIPLDDNSSLHLADRLAAPPAAPWKLISRAELAEQVRTALSRLNAQDREVLLLRQFEGLDNQEIGYLLDVTPQAVSQRHGRALRHLYAELSPVGLERGDL